LSPLYCYFALCSFSFGELLEAVEIIEAEDTTLFDLFLSSFYVGERPG
jgi:hypothetical protein